jgi:hypothetical protein
LGISKTSVDNSMEKIKFDIGHVPIDVACGANYTMVTMGEI